MRKQQTCKRKTRRRQHRLRLERLEHRRLLAVDAFAPVIEVNDSTGQTELTEEERVPRAAATEVVADYLPNQEAATTISIAEQPAGIAEQSRPQSIVESPEVELPPANPTPTSLSFQLGANAGSPIETTGPISPTESISTIDFGANRNVFSLYDNVVGLHFEANTMAGTTNGLTSGLGRANLDRLLAVDPFHWTIEDSASPDFDGEYGMVLDSRSDFIRIEFDSTQRSFLSKPYLYGVESAIEALTGVQQNRHHPIPTRPTATNPSPTSAPDQTAESFIDIASNQSTTISTVNMAISHEQFATSGFSDRSAVHFRVEPIMARHHRIEISQVAEETNTVTASAQPQAQPQVQPTSTHRGADSKALTQHTGESRRAASREGQNNFIASTNHHRQSGSAETNIAIHSESVQLSAAWSEATHIPVISLATAALPIADATVSEVDSEGEAPVITIPPETESAEIRSNDQHPWRRAVDIVMASTVGAAIYGSRLHDRLARDKG